MVESPEVMKVGVVNGFLRMKYQGHKTPQGGRDFTDVQGIGDLKLLNHLES